MGRVYLEMFSFIMRGILCFEKRVECKYALYPKYDGLFTDSAYCTVNVAKYKKWMYTSLKTRIRGYSYMFLQSMGLVLYKNNS